MKELLFDYIIVQQLVYEFFKFNQVDEMTHANTFLQYNDLQQVDKLKAPCLAVRFGYLHRIFNSHTIKTLKKLFV